MSLNCLYFISIRRVLCDRSLCFNCWWNGKQFCFGMKWKLSLGDAFSCFCRQYTQWNSASLWKINTHGKKFTWTIVILSQSTIITIMLVTGFSSLHPPIKPSSAWHCFTKSFVCVHLVLLMVFDGCISHCWPASYLYFSRKARGLIKKARLRLYVKSINLAWPLAVNCSLKTNEKAEVAKQRRPGRTCTTQES